MHFGMNVHQSSEAVTFMKIHIQKEKRLVDSATRRHLKLLLDLTLHLRE